MNEFSGPVDQKSRTGNSTIQILVGIPDTRSVFGKEFAGFGSRLITDQLEACR